MENHLVFYLNLYIVHPSYLIMTYEEIYNNENSEFFTYVKNTNQKPLLIKKIIEKLDSKINKYEKFIFTDIGAGDGIITIPVIEYLKNKTNLLCHCLEPSNLINEFKKKCEFENIEYHKEKIEWFEIPKSDFILMSHVLTQKEDYISIVKKIYNSLNKGGFALIVTTNKESDDVKLKFKLRENPKRLKNVVLTDSILDYLKSNNIVYKHEEIDTDIDYSGGFNLTKEGKDMLAFFHKKPFINITEEEIKKFQDELKKLNVSGRITKKEDYIWIYKSK